MMELHLSDAVEAAIQAKFLGMHTMIPGVVESYAGHETRLATITPSIGIKIPRGPTLKLKPIQNVPMVFPSSKGFQFTFDIAPGDPVLLLFSEVSLGNWLNGTGGSADPEDSTRFSLHDAIAIPGLFPPRAPTGLPADGQFLLASKAGTRIGGTDSGTLDLSNKETDLRAELERLWDSLKSIREDIATSFTNLGAVTTSPAALVPVGLGTPLTAALTLEATAHTSAEAGIVTDKAKLGGLLK